MTEGHAGHHANYFMVFVALCVCTMLSIIFDVIEISNIAVLIVLALGVATAKALFVLTYFMHLKFEGKWKFVLLAPTTILAIGLPLALLPDVGLHYYTYSVPQAEMLSHEHSHSAQHDAQSEGGTGQKAPEHHK